MEPQKKIKIKKTDQSSNTAQKHDATLKTLEKTLKKLENRFNQFGYNDSLEEEFINENLDKEIKVVFKDKELQGKLKLIDKYRIGIEKDDKIYYYYKHAIIGYYSI